mgnify:CR=1 FL=1
MSSQDRDYRFQTTQWSLILAARDQSDQSADEALASLCQRYWYPLFSFVRRQGFDFNTAQDITQGFYTALLEKHYLKDVAQEKGLFRSFLLKSIKHYIANQRRFENAQKRGGGQAIVSIDYSQAEQRYQSEPSHELSADQIFDQQWALELLQQVMSDLSEEHAQSDKKELFAHLQIYLTGEESTSYREIAGKLNLTEGAVKVAVHRLRQRFGQILRERIRDTVSTEEEIDAEIVSLFQAIQMQ